MLTEESKQTCVMTAAATRRQQRAVATLRGRGQASERENEKKKNRKTFIRSQICLSRGKRSVFISLSSADGFGKEKKRRGV